MCRRAGCTAPAADLGLCKDHAARQPALRADIKEPAPVPPPGPKWLADLAAAREEPWRVRAACRGGMISTMFPESHDHGPVDYRPALDLCFRCPVIDPCREAGAREVYGVWGGTTPADRGVGPRNRRRR